MLKLKLKILLLRALPFLVLFGWFAAIAPGSADQAAGGWSK